MAPHSASLSPELTFTDASESGLSIVPASCASNPHSTTAGDCTCSIGLSPSTIQAGDSATLSWTSTDEHVKLTGTVVGTITPGVGRVKKRGSTTVSPTKTTTYTFTSDHGFSCSRKLTVEVPKKPSCTLSASPASRKPGQNFTLSYTTQRATSASINRSVGSVELPRGNKSLSAPAQTTVYTMTVRGQGGTETCNATILVDDVNDAPSCSISVPSPKDRGEAVTLSYNTLNATSASINQGIGSVSVPSGTHNFNAPNQTTTYTMTVQGTAGRSATCNDTLTINPATLSCQLYALPSPRNPGQSFTLSWNTSGATSATVNQSVGAVTPVAGGSKNLTAPSQTRTYTMTARAANGNTQTCNSTLIVSSQCEPGPSQCINGQNCQCVNGNLQCTGTCGGSPTLEITAEPALVRTNDRVDISWSASRVAVGSCAVTNSSTSESWPGASGTHQSSPITERTVFTLTCRDFLNRPVTDGAVVNVIPVFEEE